MSKLRIVPSAPLADGAVDPNTGLGRFPWRAHFDVIRDGEIVARVSVDSEHGTKFHVEAGPLEPAARQSVERRLRDHFTSRHEVR